MAMSMEQKKKSGLPKVIAVTSGKGGAGKTNFVINTGIALSQQGLRTYIIDADLGTANVDVLLKINSKYTIQNLVDKTMDSVMDIVADGPEGLKIIPGGSGLQSLTDLPEDELARVIGLFEPLEEHADVILIDTGAGISRNVVNFLLASDEIIVIITPEPHSMMDAYSMIKVLSEKKVTQPVKLVFNMVDNLEDGKAVAKRMLQVIGRFLEITPQPLWYIVKDDSMSRGLRQFKPLLLYKPSSQAAKCFITVAEKLNPLKNADTRQLMEQEAPKGLASKLKRFFSK